MSTLRRGDDEMHYSDNSHRWVAPPDVEQSVWEARVRAHLDRHLMTLSAAAVDPDEPRDALRFIPRPRRPDRSESVAKRSSNPKAYVGFRPR